MAFGEIGLLPEQFYRMTRAEFLLMAKGYQRKEAKDWEQTRMIAYYGYANIYEGKGKTKKSITQFLPLPLIDNDRKPHLSSEYVKNRRAFFLARLGNN